MASLSRKAGHFVLLCVSVAALLPICKGAETNEPECTDNGWRGVKIVASTTTNENFQPDQQEYYTTYVKPRLIPSAVLLAIAAVLLLSFVFWRLFLCCCRGCCRCCQPVKHPRKLLTGTSLCLQKTSVLLLSIGVLAVSAWGMTKIEPKYPDKAFSVAHSVKGFISDLLDTADGIVITADSINGVLDDVGVIFRDDVNISDVNAAVVCLTPWLTNLANPSDIKGNLDAISNVISTDVQPNLNDLTANVQYLLGVDVPKLSSAVVEIGNGSSFLAEYEAQVTAAQSKNSDLQNAAANDFPAAQAFYNYLNGVLDLPLKLQRLSSLSIALTDFQAAKDNTTTITNSISEVTALQNANDTLVGTSGSLPELSSQLTSVENGFNDVQPCIDALIERALHINDTVVVLPADMESSIYRFQDVTNSLEAFVTSPTTSPSMLANNIDIVTASLRMGGTVLTSAKNGLQDTKDALNNAPDTTNMQTYVSTLTGLTNNRNDVSQLNSVAEFLVYFINIYQPNQSSEDSNMRTKAAATSASLAPLLTALNGPGRTDASSQSSASSSTQMSLNSLPPQSDIDGSLDSMRSGINSLPPFGPYESQLDGIASSYNTLPANKADLLTTMTSALSELSTSVDQAISTARANVAQSLGTVKTQLQNARGKTVVKVDEKEAEYRPNVDKYNKWRVYAMYAYFAVAIVAVLVCSIMVLLNCQCCSSFFAFFLLVLSLLFSLVAVVLVLVVIVGNDGCANMEAQLITRIPDLQKGPESQKTLALANYYLYETGGPIRSIIKNATGIDLTDKLAMINKTRNDAIQDITGDYILQPKMEKIVTKVVNITDAVVGQVSIAEAQVSYEGVHPIYMEVKTFACCTTLDMLGNLWLATSIDTLFLVLLLIILFFYIRRLDRLPSSRRCCGCGMRSYREFADTGLEEGRAMQAKQKGKLVQYDQLNSKGSGTLGEKSAASPLEETSSGFIKVGGLTDDGSASVETSSTSRGALLNPDHKKKDAGKKTKGKKAEKQAYMDRVLKMSRMQD